MTSTDLVARIDELTRAVKRLEQAQRQPERKAYKPSEVGALIGCNAQTVRNLINDGRLEAHDMGGWWLVPATAVDRFLNRK